MEKMDIHAQIEDLEVNIDELTDALSPLLNTPLATTTSTLPLLDKAKLYVLLSYSIESLLFSALQASGQDARQHPIFAELGRLKAYFTKIQDAEKGPAVPKAKIDKDAVGRFVKHGLAGNDKYDMERAERIAKEKARASLRKAKGTHTKFGEPNSAQKQGQTPKKRGASPTSSEAKADATASPSSSNEDVSDKSASPSPSPPTQHKKRRRTGRLHRGPKTVDAETAPQPAPSDPSSAPPTSTKPASKPFDEAARRAEKESRRERKQQRRIKAQQAAEAKQEQVIPTNTAGAGKGGHSDMFNQLLEGTFEGRKPHGGSKGKKGKKDKAQ